MNLVAHKYTPGEMSERELDATFAARGHTVDYLLKSLRDQVTAGTLSSFVVTGPRGAGKSTVIRMVALRLQRDQELRRAWIPVVFPEEQFGIASLRDFLAAILRELATMGLGGADRWLGKVEAEANDEQSEQLAITGLRELTRKAGRRLVVFVENLNLLLDECLDDQMKGTLRRLLMTDPFMMLVGSAVHVLESLNRYDEALFNYFGPVPLDRLSAEQVFELLQRRAEFDGNERFLRDFREQRPKIRAIVHLSGGNPRLILMLYELLSQQQVTTIVQCLRQLVDEFTPLLKDEMENLPPQQRKIVHALMERGGTAQPADLVERTRLPLNAITTQLRRLKDAQIVELLGGGKGRAAYYTVPDRLFVIWYQMRYLNQNRRRIELFVEVLRVWFEAEERFATVQSLANVDDTAPPSALREAALTSEYFAASLADTPFAQAARDHVVQQWLRSGDHREAAMAHADFEGLALREGKIPESAVFLGLGHWCAEHKEWESALEILNHVLSDPERNAAERAAALLERGRCFHASGDHSEAVADFSAVTTLPGATSEQVVRAFLGRGLGREALNDHEGALRDFTHVAELADRTTEAGAFALLNRGFILSGLGDEAGALADYTAVAELAGAPAQTVALALLGRAALRGSTGDHAGGIQDCTAVLVLEGVPGEELCMALFGRGDARWALGLKQAAMADWAEVLKRGLAPADGVEAAARRLYLFQWSDGAREEADSTLDRLAEWLAGLPVPEKAWRLGGFMARLASSAVGEAWAYAARRLLRAQSLEARQALAFLEPVCAVLEGGERSLLDPLPPEQREFALEVLARFDGQHTLPAVAPGADAASPGAPKGKAAH